MRVCCFGMCWEPIYPKLAEEGTVIPVDPYKILNETPVVKFRCIFSENKVPKFIDPSNNKKNMICPMFHRCLEPWPQKTHEKKSTRAEPPSWSRSKSCAELVLWKIWAGLGTWVWGGSWADQVPTQADQGFFPPEAEFGCSNSARKSFSGFFMADQLYSSFLRVCWAMVSAWDTNFMVDAGRDEAKRWKNCREIRYCS